MKSLGQRLDGTRRSFDPVWDVHYDRFVETMRAAGAASGSPSSLSDLTENGSKVEIIIQLLGD
jgi:hypothetical protein